MNDNNIQFKNKWDSIMVLTISLDYIALSTRKTDKKLEEIVVRSRQYIQFDDERVFNGEQNVFFVLDMFDLFKSDDLSDRKHLQSEVLETRLVSNQNNSTKSTRTCSR